MEKETKSLLQSITSQDVDVLIAEQELRDSGHQFYYFIDNHDISKYTFPFGLIDKTDWDKIEERSIDVITDEQIAYNYLINNFIFGKQLLLFDEHKEELNNFINTIRHFKNIGLRIVDSFLKQAELYSQVISEPPLFNNWINDQKKLSSKLNVSYFISIALGGLYKGEERLKFLLEKKINYNDATNFPQGVDSDLFSSSTKSQKAELLFDKLSEHYNKGMRSYSIRYARSQKCIVYDRLLSINQKSIKDKNLFVLVSSSKTTKEILPLIAKQSGFSFEIDGVDFNPIRSVNQIYLQMLLDKRTDKQSEFELIKNLVSQKEKNPSAELDNEYSDQNKMIDDQINRKFEQYISNERSNYENTSLLLNDYTRENIFRKALSGDKLGNHHYIVENINELVKIAEKTNILNKLRASSLNNIEFIDSYVDVLRRGFDKIKDGDNAHFLVYSGADPIKNIYDALPLVFFKNDCVNFTKAIKAITRFVRNIPVNYSNSKELVKEINQAFNLLLYKVEPNEEERIIMLILFLMLNIPTKDHSNPNEAAFDWITKMFASNAIGENWTPDFHYVKSLICRRIELYDESIDIARRMSEEYPDDPRFYHSMSLGYYCLCERESIANQQLSYLDQSIYYCKEALSKYNLKKENNKAVELAIYSILNGLTYLYTLKHVMTKTENNNDPENLKNAYHFLDDLIIKDIYFDKTVPFLHTSAFLYFHDYQTGGLSSKLELASETIQKALNIKTDNETRQKCIDLKNEIDAYLNPS